MTTLESNIIMRVKAAYWLGRSLDQITTRRSLFAVLLGLIWWKVSLLNVARNAIAIGRPDLVYQYSTSAFSGTEILVKILVLGLLSLVAWVTFDLARNLRFRLSRPVSKLSVFL